MSFIDTSTNNGVGEIVLNRPKALNALDQSMVDDMYQTLLAWGDDARVDTVLVTSGSDRAFCAGGDIRAIREHALAGETEEVHHYFESEYRLDQLIAEYPKPYVTLIDGVVMGGGLGISVHGEVRVVTEKAVAAMPETGIGFFPDIGASYFLPRLPEGVGMWMGLTGERVSGEGMIAVGLATHYVRSHNLPHVAAAIRGGARLADAFANYVEPAAVDIDMMDKAAQYFDDNNVTAIMGGLRGAVAVDDLWATEALRALEAASPTSLLVTANLIDKGSSSQLDECFDRELHAADRITTGHDFAEGVRAVLVDKDRDPQWDPATVEDVDAATVYDIVGD
ncbi:enoyl-CoA hydratase/isomerase family protein [Gordonia jinhuaensis]|uniref:3-hydroxyisobutyryl-CoA hydrolase n=1 Tax=Gordonia jinhuaensis TaxID=1517702 RepID=A0A916T1H5_9ACTN|nr:enoyl-CoA hydratase/isomerase family protein [Gordonia jinhuaensis]GGB27584.1 enoyl-CoA hydratase [Gordonia jinhuaensis]